MFHQNKKNNPVVRRYSFIKLLKNNRKFLKRFNYKINKKEMLWLIIQGFELENILRNK